MSHLSLTIVVIEWWGAVMTLRHPGVFAAALLLTGSLLAACGSDDESTAASASGPTETEGAEPRLVVASGSSVEILDATTLESIETFEVESMPKLAVAGDGRHVWTLQSEAGVVGAIDAGTWTEAHGDHGHSYADEPTQLDDELDGGTSYHAVSDGERSVIWWDDSGELSTVNDSSLASGRVRERTIAVGEPHHGVGAPTADGGFLVSTSVDGEATGVAAIDESGTETARWETCPGLHGETHVGEDGYAFGCATGILVVAGQEARNIASPVEGAGTGALATDGESPVLAGTLSSEDDESLATKVALYDTAAGTSRVVDLGVEYSNLTASEGGAYAVGTDGALHRIDLATGEVTSIDVIDSWDKPEDWMEPRPNVAVAGHHAWVTDAKAKTVTVVDLETGETGETGSLEAAPTSLVVVNAGEHDH